MVFEIPGKLDRLEGLGYGYKETSSLVQAVKGAAIRVVYYVAEPEYIDRSLLPYDWYKEHVQCGARDFDLPDSWMYLV